MYNKFVSQTQQKHIAQTNPLKKHSKIVVGIVALLLALAVSACGTTEQPEERPLPTLVDPTTWPTALFLTENAPPTGFGEVDFSNIDRHLEQYQGWTYTVTGFFEGTADADGEPVRGELSVRVEGHEPGQKRRVVLQAEGRAFLPHDALLKLEGVRWSNDYYIVDVNGVCTVDIGGHEIDSAVADLSAGQLIGGVTRAVPTGHRQQIEGLEAWQYTFAPEAVRLPTVARYPESQVQLEADLWIAPEINAVVRYEVTAQVSHVHLFWADRNGSTVTGTLYLRYDLDVPALDVLPNISVPHGC